MSESTDIQVYVRERRAEIDAALLDRLPAAPDCPRLLVNAMRYSITAGGKRLRPILCLASAEAVGGSRTMAMPAACAIELIHTYSLIHDDLPAMDNDTMRRGQPTLHVLAGEATAVLAGDALLTEAFHLLAREPVGSTADLAHRKLRAIATVAAAAGPMGMVGGQVIDLACVTPDASGHPPAPLDAEGLRTMHAKKTGALIRASAAVGAIMGGAMMRACRPSTVPLPNWAWRFKSWTTCSTSKGRRPSSGRRRARTQRRASRHTLRSTDSTRRSASPRSAWLGPNQSCTMRNSRTRGCSALVAGSWNEPGRRVPWPRRRRACAPWPARPRGPAFPTRVA
jgi:hypothetical protein